MLRDCLREIIRGHLQDKIRMTELEFQPEHDENWMEKQMWKLVYEADKHNLW